MIRRYTLDDLDGMLDHVQDHLSKSRFKRISFARNKIRDRLVGNVNNSQFFCNVAVEDDKVIAGLCASVMAYTFSHDAIAFDHFFYIQPTRRSMPLATELVASYVEWAKERKVKEVLLQNYAGAKAEAFAKFSERLGFKQAGTFHVMEI